MRINSAVTILRKLSECARVLAPLFEAANDARMHLSLRIASRRGGQACAKFSKAYVPLRIALNVPCLDGRSPTDGENSTSPVIKSAVSNFPLQINVPASRPTLPSRNSTGAEKVTEFPSPRLHFASEGLAPPQTLAAGSVNCNEPLPSPCASKRSEWCRSFAKVISTFHVPVMLGDSCHRGQGRRRMCSRPLPELLTRAAFTFFHLVRDLLSGASRAFFGTDLAGAYSVLGVNSPTL